MKILYIGDVMAESGMAAVEKVLPGIVQTEGIDFVVAQAENVTDGKGMSPEDMQRLRAAGVHAFSGGNHTPSLLGLTSFLENPAEPVVGPANMVSCPGPGYKLVDSRGGKVLVASLLGNIVGKQADLELENPLKKVDDILAAVPRDSYITAVVNLHGDFSSEKLVFGHYLDGRVGVVVGDHWHVPTADAQVLPKGTAHITDVGMCGSLDSSLGVTFESIIPRWRDGYQTRNELETSGRMQFCALLVELDETTGRATSARHLREVW
jgi:metallophosphoesterase (TIGR00282 family)